MGGGGELLRREAVGVDWLELFPRALRRDDIFPSLGIGYWVLCIKLICKKKVGMSRWGVECGVWSVEGQLSTGDGVRINHSLYRYYSRRSFFFFQKPQLLLNFALAKRVVRLAGFTGKLVCGIRCAVYSTVLPGTAHLPYSG